VGTVIVDLSISLDGYVAGPDDGGAGGPLGRGGDALFTWMGAGPPENAVERRLRPPVASLPVVREWLTAGGAMISGRRTFDIAGGWADGHPIDLPIFVVTHEPPTEGEWSLFDHFDGPIELEQMRVVPSDGVTHLRYRVVRGFDRYRPR
jgi:hypothetical protein